jgi:hypothetical protein
MATKQMGMKIPTNASEAVRVQEILSAQVQNHEPHIVSLRPNVTVSVCLGTSDFKTFCVHIYVFDENDEPAEFFRTHVPQELEFNLDGRTIVLPVVVEPTGTVEPQ